MTNSDVITGVIGWIEEHLREELPVTAVARKSGYSLHHFIRLFGGVIGLPPKEYILRRKLSEAARELSGGGRLPPPQRRRVTDIAFEYGFRDLETFSRAFRRELGATPTAVRRGASFDYLEAAGRQRRGKAAPPSGISEPPILERINPFCLAGWSIRVSGEGGEVGRLWKKFITRAPAVPRQVSPPRFLQLASWTEESEDTFDIMVGVEVTDLAELPIDIAGKTVPGCSCLVFTLRGSVERIKDGYRAIYEEWLPRCDRRPTLPFNFERYFEDAGDPYSNCYSMQICVPVS